MGLPSESRPWDPNTSKRSEAPVIGLRSPITRSLNTTSWAWGPQCYYCPMRLSPGKHCFHIRIAVILNSILTLLAVTAFGYVLSLGPRPFCYFCGYEIPWHSSPVALCVFLSKGPRFLTFICARFSVYSCRRSCIRLSLTFDPLDPLVCIGVGIVRCLDYT